AAGFERRGLTAAILSLDDLYLSRTDRAALASKVHPLLATRGVPGTHDVALGLTTIRALHQGEAVPLPRFDKATDDRSAPASWPIAPAGVDIVLFEGWCVGARPQSTDSLISPVNPLEAAEDGAGAWRRYVNDALAGPYQELFSTLDMLILLAAPSFE